MAWVSNGVVRKVTQCGISVFLHIRRMSAVYLPPPPWLGTTLQICLSEPRDGS